MTKKIYRLRVNKENYQLQKKELIISYIKKLMIIFKSHFELFSIISKKTNDRIFKLYFEVFYPFPS